jgi:signal transduction histidine kinase
VLDYTVQVLDNDKDLRYYYGYLIDISDLYQRYTELNYNRKLAEMAERSKDIFLSSITDEISSPIKAMFSSITKLSHSGIDEEQQDSLLKLYVSAHRLNSVILQLQTYLYYSSTAVEMHSSWIKADALIRKQVPLMIAKADAKNITFDYTGTDSDLSIFYSIKYIEDILNILFDNALKFSDSGTISLKYEFDELAGNDGLARICITDEGIGLPEEKMEYVLEPFTQVDASYTRERGGIGLGLATLKNIMKISDGSISIKNRSTKGVEVCVEWMVAYRNDSW